MIEISAGARWSATMLEIFDNCQNLIFEIHNGGKIHNGGQIGLKLAILIIKNIQTHQFKSSKDEYWTELSLNMIILTITNNNNNA